MPTSPSSNAEAKLKAEWPCQHTKPHDSYPSPTPPGQEGDSAECTTSVWGSLAQLQCPAELLRWLGRFEGLLSIKKNKKEAKSAAVRDAGKIYSGWSKGSLAGRKGLEVDGKEIPAGERNSSWQGQACTRLVLLGRAAWNPVAGLGHSGEKRPVCRHLEDGFGEGSYQGKQTGRALKAQLINQMKPGLRDQNMTDFKIASWFKSWCCPP